MSVQPFIQPARQRSQRIQTSTLLHSNTQLVVVEVFCFCLKWFLVASINSSTNQHWSLIAVYVDIKASLCMSKYPSLQATTHTPKPLKTFPAMMCNFESFCFFSSIILHNMCPAEWSLANDDVFSGNNCDIRSIIE